MADVEYALSIKQPWAALVVLGLKTIEIRRWNTGRRGPILIHAARIPDDREVGWRALPAEAKELAQLRGGVIGSVHLTSCVAYHDLTSFAGDQAKHHNESSWFEPPVLYGFTFTNPRIEPFRVYPGWFKFFKVESKVPVRG